MSSSKWTSNLKMTFKMTTNYFASIVIGCWKSRPCL